MLKRAAMCLVVIALIFPFISCTRIDAGKTAKEGGLIIEKLADRASIPSKWGNLVNVNYVDDWHAFTLWFQDKDGNIRVAYLNTKTNQLDVDSLLIPQK